MTNWNGCTTSQYTFSLPFFPNIFIIWNGSQTCRRVQTTLSPFDLFGRCPLDICISDVDIQQKFSCISAAVTCDSVMWITSLDVCFLLFEQSLATFLTEASQWELGKGAILGIEFVAQKQLLIHSNCFTRGKKKTNGYKWMMNSNYNTPKILASFKHQIQHFKVFPKQLGNGEVLTPYKSLLCLLTSQLWGLVLNKTNSSTASKGTDLSLRKAKRNYSTGSKIENFVVEFYCSISFQTAARLAAYSNAYKVLLDKSLSNALTTWRSKD